MVEAQRIQLREQLDQVLKEIAASQEDLPTETSYLQLLGEEIAALKTDYLSHLLDMTTSIQKNEWTAEELVDIGFLLREHTSLLKDWKIETSQRHDLAGRVNAVRLMKKAIEKPMEAEDTVRGVLATGTQFSKIQPKVPKKGTREYREVMDHFGINQDLVDQGVVKFDWNGLGAYATEQAEKGGRLPKGLRDTFPVCGMVYRRRHISKGK